MPNTLRIALSTRIAALANPTLLSAALALVLLLLFTILALSYIHTSQERAVREHLDTSVNSVAQLITLWQQQNIGALQLLANTAQGKALLTQVLREEGNNPATHEALADWLYPVLTVMGFDGFSVINHERVIVAASTKAYRKQPVQLPETLEVLDKALVRRPAISRPIAAVHPLEGPRGVQPAGTLMQNMCVLFEPAAAPAGYFCLRFNTQSSFFPIFLNGRLGNTGETYAIDNRGRFMTPARFVAPQRAQSAAAPPNTLHVGHEVRLPGARGLPGPFTAIVEFLMQHQSGYLKIGYDDYRGVPVVGAGRWIQEMELGVIVEQDLDEAMALYVAARNIIISLSLSATVLILMLTLTAIINRRRVLIREGRFRSLLDNLPAATHMTSMDGKLLVVNPAFCKLLHIDKHELVGSSMDSLPAPNWLKPLLRTDEHLGAEPFWTDYIIELRDPEGHPRFYHTMRFPVIYTQGQAPQAIASIWVDATERVVASQRLADVNHNLEHIVGERTQELRRVKDEALAASRAKAEFLANMSHEIRTPLNAIIGLAHVALASKPDARQRTYLEKMRGSGEHLLQVINDILSFSRMEAGKLTLDHSEFSVAQIVDKTLGLIWEKAVAKGLQVNVEIDALIPPLLVGDPLRLGQILINFCANAVKFTDRGSIDIRVTKVRDWEQRVELLFEVTDSGIGIDAQQLQNLFQPFQQVDSSSARRFEGTGLGLSICKSLADLMNARIDVKSAPGQGSCFRLRVQLQKTNPQSAADSLIQSAPVVTPLALVDCQVLVVEDNALNQEIMVSLLDTMGASSLCVASGPEALAAVGKQQFTLVLMDIQLPGMDGVETTARIRALPGGNHLPIIAVTANALPGDREKYLAAGMDDYLSKPIEPANLHRLLLRWANSGRPATAHIAADKLAPVAITTAEQNPFALLRAGGIDTARALHNLMDNAVLYRRLLERFARERAEFSMQLQHLLQAHPAEALNQVHSLKSLAGSLGMTELEKVCFHLEQQLQGDGEDDNARREGQAQLAVELAAMVDLVNRYLSIAPAR